MSSSTPALITEVLGTFVKDCIQVEQGSTVQSNVLYDLFLAWAKIFGLTVQSKKGFTCALKDLGFDTHRSHGVQRWEDIKTNKTVVDLLDRQQSFAMQGGRNG